jgi:mono/diheme cytochrome c family protein
LLIRWLAPLTLVLAGLIAQVALAAPLAQDSAQGQTLYDRLGCSTCHGDRGEGSIGPRLAGTTLSWEEFLAQVRTPTGVMPNFPPSLAPDDRLLDVYAYLRELGGLPATVGDAPGDLPDVAPPEDAPPADPEEIPVPVS